MGGAEEPLPSFFSPFRFILPSELAQREELARMIIAYGGTWQEELPTEDGSTPATPTTTLLMIATTTPPQSPGSLSILRPSFITHSAQQRQLVDRQRYQLSAPS